jgi:hypothetical protein
VRTSAFSSKKKSHEHYAEEMKKVNADRAAERNSLLNTLLGKQKTLETRKHELQDFTIEETNAEFRDNFKGDLLKTREKLNKVTVTIEEARELGE